MITEAIGNWFLALVASLIGLVPALPAAATSALDSFPTTLGNVVAYIGLFGPVAPFSQMAIALGINLAFWVIAILLQGTRIVLSYVTLGGGGV